MVTIRYSIVSVLKRQVSVNKIWFLTGLTEMSRDVLYYSSHFNCTIVSYREHMSDKGFVNRLF